MKFHRSSRSYKWLKYFSRFVDYKGCLKIIHTPRGMSLVFYIILNATTRKRQKQKKKRKGKITERTANAHASTLCVRT